MYYEATVFATQVGAVNLALMDSERGGRRGACRQSSSLPPMKVSVYTLFGRFEVWG